ncbi:Predicted dehydrogenase [Meinhardsimonia xiamenensis]|jgi:predicted dehydrogenase|uniref:Predicted dehydrogenase n=1 Tax=Meinhardsimonia xiamenensis TaxID=990712 RepID=A0A1G9E2Z5_9RHOB|nr:Gfo/Idh/MocA family oxidoreductase [Meinhardsimonia xiamenensis]PRX33945.1 putative dehydrogenase [Meinhardsimonia xiamenensis]SDK70516.1 Predicted dehydrogenase [Meinhardsimonia xiamenensis]
MSVAIAVAGGGLMGRQHIKAIAESGAVRLHAVIDPDPAAQAVAEGAGGAWFPDLAAALEVSPAPQGVILATPNRLHVEQALACVAAGVPVLVEKPLATSTAEAARLVEAAEAAAVPVLVGHHRRHSPFAAATKRLIETGALGELVAADGICWLYKPEDYFAPEWRRQPGGGPILINLVHDIDLMRHFMGEVAGVQATASSARRGFAVEDTAAVILEFASGAVATLSVSDTAVAPWSWELTAAENPAYPVTGQSCYRIAGTRAALSVPDMRLWRNPGARGWWEPIAPETVAVTREDPLLRQIRHFAAVIEGREAPLVPAREGLATLKVVEAIRQALVTGCQVAPGEM